MTATAEQLLPQFEGLVFETARQIVAEGVELELDDVRQILRIKVWRALLAYDTGHEKRLPLRRYVFMCVTNQRKDIEKRPRRYNLSIDELRERSSRQPLATLEPGSPRMKIADWFDYRYLSTDAEQVFGPVEDEEVKLPSTLTRLERRVVRLRLAGRLMCEIDRELGLSRVQREKVMRSIREKLADWRPTGQPRSAPMRPLPDVAPQRSDARVPQAA